MADVSGGPSAWGCAAMRDLSGCPQAAARAPHCCAAGAAPLAPPRGIAEAPRWFEGPGRWGGARRWWQQEFAR
eukprot:1812584-Lingulodinium_polyedra.AAC.1